MNQLYKVSFNSLEENVRLIEPLIENLKYSTKLEEEEIANMVAAVSEAIHNAIMHGNSASADKMVNVECLVNEKSVTFTIQDEGKGFNANSIPDPTDPEHLENVSGRGIFIIKNLADSFTSEADKGKVTIKFKR